MGKRVIPSLSKCDNEGNVHVAWKREGASRAGKVTVEGQVKKSGSWWALVTQGGAKQGGFKTRKAAAEWVVAQVNPYADDTAKAAPALKNKRQPRSKKWAHLTAEDIIRERDEKQQSWKQVAQALELGTPGTARKAYAALTGKPHTESVLAGRTTRTTGGEMVEGQELTPIFTGAETEEEILERLRGVNRITRIRSLSGANDYEDITVKKVLGVKSRRELVEVEVRCSYTGATRTLAAHTIVRAA